MAKFDRKKKVYAQDALITLFTITGESVEKATEKLTLIGNESERRYMLSKAIAHLTTDNTYVKFSSWATDVYSLEIPYNLFDIIRAETLYSGSDKRNN